MSFHLSEILLILLVALLVIKPAHLPDVARALGRFIRWAKQTSEKIKSEINR